MLGFLVNNVTRVTRQMFMSTVTADNFFSRRRLKNDQIKLAITPTREITQYYMTINSKCVLQCLVFESEVILYNFPIQFFGVFRLLDFGVQTNTKHSVQTARAYHNATTCKGISEIVKIYILRTDPRADEGIKYDQITPEK